MNPRLSRRTTLVALFLLVSLALLTSLNGRVSNAQGGQVQVTAADPPSTAQGMRKA